MMIAFVYSTDKVRERMWKAVNGPHLLIVLMNKNNNKTNIKVFDSIVAWLKLDPRNIEKYLCSGKNLLDLFKFVFSSPSNCSIQEYMHVLNSIKNIIDYSEKLAKFIAFNKDLVRMIVKQLSELKDTGVLKNEISSQKNSQGVKPGSHSYSQSSSHLSIQKNPYNLQTGHNLTQVLRELLEIIDLLIEKSGYPLKNFMHQYKLTPILTQVYQLAKAEKLVILHEM